MSVVSPFRFVHPLADGRQSDRAMLVRRGVQRLCVDLGAVALPEVMLKGGRRADLLVMTQKSEFWIVEIKTSIEDLRADNKWPDYRAHCDRLFFATHPAVPMDIFPADAGFILSDGHGAEILTEAPAHPLAGATRKALLQRFARLAASRLMLAEMAGLDVPSLDEDVC
ncbi:MmcB family DNA repair protein [Notoacmeibacter sp. MSK16QG-6]|uniref:MmcB family DNA repair protein n=1 Tax=Notoacmeibacter sp. MSK16QG-6 TaxID=2957982 RepID=UPI00209FA647|nr:MmcB family DNA repair protein [Notoacmeibacter sp. MSK16QG-6]MCP1198921.1 MmcB family DNA repair protein [Notoacmeibacter sp. MSK16QG-6]